MALAISEIDRSTFSEWKSDGEPKSFLDGIRQTRLLEDAMIEFDKHSIPGYEKIYPHISGGVTFTGNQTRLTVITANRTSLEKQFGVDLIYYNETFKSFVMVQYKAMDPGTGGEPFYRPDNQFRDEIRRMDVAYRQINFALTQTECDSYRFETNPFFLKFCPRIVLDRSNMDQIPGMYIPLNYWKLLEQSTYIQGPNNGQILTYKNVRRYLNNSEFISLVRKAWVGTTIYQSDELVPLVLKIIETGRTVVFAVNKSENPRNGF